MVELIARLKTAAAAKTWAWTRPKGYGASAPIEPAPFKPELYVCPFGAGMGYSFTEQTEFIGDPNGEPFAVQARGNRWTPLSVLIFASSEADAIARVSDGVRRIHARNIEQAARYEEMDHGMGAAVTAQSQKILDLIAQGQIWAEAFDKRALAKAIWAGNDTLA